MDKYWLVQANGVTHGPYPHEKLRDAKDMMTMLLTPRGIDGERSANSCLLILVRKDATRFEPEDLGQNIEDF